MVKRIFVQKRKGYDVEAKGILSDLRESLQMSNLEDVIILNRYDVEGISDKVFEEAKSTIFSEPQVDICYEEEYKTAKNEVMFGVEFLPGQFDQRANSLSECLQIIGGEPLIGLGRFQFILEFIKRIDDLFTEDFKYYSSYLKLDAKKRFKIKLFTNGHYPRSWL